MKQAEKKHLKNFFELQAIYLRELQHGNISKEKYIEKITLMSINTINILEIE